MTRKDHTGLTYGKLKVTGFSHTEGAGKSARAVWSCLCECGRTKPIRAEILTRKVNPAQHCGCAKTYKDRAPVPKAKTPRPPAPTAEEKKLSYTNEKRPYEGEWRRSLILAARRSLTPWKEVSELVSLPVEECKRLIEQAA